MKKAIGVLALLFLCSPARSQQLVEQEKSFEVYFEFNSSEIKKDVSNNEANLQGLASYLDTINNDPLLTIKQIDVDSYASPEGTHSYNIRLSKDRSDSMYEYLINELNISKELINHDYRGVAWGTFWQIMEKSSLPFRDDVIEILKSTTEEDYRNAKRSAHDMFDRRVDMLKKLDAGVPYDYMESMIFPKLRSSAIVVFHLEPVVAALPAEETPVAIVPTRQENVRVMGMGEDPNTFIAIKTNLAAYIPLIFNVGVEIPIGNHFSIDLPIYYSPYTVFNDYSFRVLMTQPEFRYWITSPLKGHFFGLHAMGGWYNAAWNSTTRYQDADGDTPFYGAGLSYGYALNLNDKWGFEFTAGFGYARFEYDMFFNIDNGAKYDTRKIDYWGPTKLGVNLVYKLNVK